MDTLFIHKRFKRIIAAVAAIVACAAVAAQDAPAVSEVVTQEYIRYVKTTAGGGQYTNDGKSWATAKNNIQDAINDLYANMRKSGQRRGRVYVAAGKYTPTESTETSGDGVLYTSFKLYPGIELYGGFAPGETRNDITPQEREMKPYPATRTDGNRGWELKYTTTLSGGHSLATTPVLTWDPTKNKYNEVIPGNSYHVVWFATEGFVDDDADGSDQQKDANRQMLRARPLADTAVVDGFTITEGAASNREVNKVEHNSFGGGVYMVGRSVLRNCIVTDNMATRRGGGVYMDGGGLVEKCMISKNQCCGVGVTEGYGGGVCVDFNGRVRHSVIENNSSRIGGGLHMRHIREEYPQPNAVEGDMYYVNRYTMSAAACIVNNNTAQAEAGGVFMQEGGTINHIDIVRNKCTGTGVVSSGRRLARSAGLYIDRCGIVFNSLCWGGENAANRDIQYAAFTGKSDGELKPYVYFSGFANQNITDWSGSVSSNLVEIQGENANLNVPGRYPQFANPTVTAGVYVGAAPTETPGAEMEWKPLGTSDLRAKGVPIAEYGTYGLLTSSTVETDLYGNRFSPRAMLGALVPAQERLKHVLAPSVELGEEGQLIPTLFVDPSRELRSSPRDALVGASWDVPMVNINDALTYFSCDAFKSECPDDYAIGKYQVLVKEGQTTTVGNYLFSFMRSSRIAMQNGVRLYGGYPVQNTGTSVAGRNPKLHPTRISANITNGEYSRNSIHVVSFNNCRNAIIDGFQLYYGNSTDTPYGQANVKNGGGVLVHNSLSETQYPDGRIDMTGNKVRNCVIANCTAVQGAGVYVLADNSTKVELELTNCIVHNNASVTDATPSAIVVSGANAGLYADHCTVRGNVGYGLLAENGAHATLDNSAIHANAQKSVALVSAVNTADVRAIAATGGGTVSGNNNLIDAGQPLPDGMAYSTNKAVLTYSNTADGVGTYPKFVNPTNNVGVSEGDDMTLYGGLPDFTPTNMNPMVNAAAGSPADMAATDLTGVNTRTYGGAPDIGALEDTNLPERGKVMYVRNTDGQDAPSRGGSWGTAFKTVTYALAQATANTDIWVAAGTYTESVSLADGKNIYGGFIALGNPGMVTGERDISCSDAKYNTIIDGGGTNRTLLIYNTASMCEGFTIRNGYVKDSYGAGVWIEHNNAVLKNCMVTENNGQGTCGAGVYINKGTVKNCVISKNTMNGKPALPGGAGVYVNGAGSKLINSLVVENKVIDRTGNNILGAGVYLNASGVFYNCTVAYNYADNKRTNGQVGKATTGGVWDQTGTSQFYNCIFWGNAANGNTKENYYQVGIPGYTTGGGLSNTNFHDCYHAAPEKDAASDEITDAKVYITKTGLGTSETEVQRYVTACRDAGLFNADYSINRLSALSRYCINMGASEDLLADNGVTVDIAGAPRVQDCKVDKGAYEYNGALGVTPTVAGGVATYYVTQNGAGMATANTPSDAACASKIQKVLDAAGRYKYDNPTQRVEVRLAGFSGGYRPQRTAAAQTLSDENPRSWSIIVPRGVTLSGGYSDTDGGFADGRRNVMANKTVLNGEYATADGQTTNVYHVVTFTDKIFNADGQVMTDNSGQPLSLHNALAAAGANENEHRAVVDGLFITGGMATGLRMEGVISPDVEGGAAIVPGYGHVRNCILTANTATERGGALHMQPGALVSGCVIMGNSAARGGAIYVDEPAYGTADKAYVLTSTIVDNRADYGGGIYFTTNLRANSVAVWHNTANSDANVSGQTDPYGANADMEQRLSEYPMSFSAVESITVPGINNITISADENKGVRWATSPIKPQGADSLFYIKEYSVLARAGMSHEDYDRLRSVGYEGVCFPTLEVADMAGVDRLNTPANGYIEIGARAYIGSLMPEISTTDMLMTRLYVVSSGEINGDNAELLQTNTGTTAADRYYRQKGSSFANPMQRLDDALEYVRTVRMKALDAANGTEQAKWNDQLFEIYLSAGTYYPLRTIYGNHTHSRGNTYLVPEKVAIYGGLNSAMTDGGYYGKDKVESAVTVNGVSIIGRPSGQILNSRARFDLNANGIIEPWEFEFQTVLSGDVVKTDDDRNVYHVISCIADRNLVGKLPTPSKTESGGNGKMYKERGVSVVLDGLRVSDGYAFGYQKETAESPYTYYKGGAVCVDGNWQTGTVTSDGKSEPEFKTYKDENGRSIDRPVGYRNIPLEIRNCLFSNNTAGMGGAIYSDGEVLAYGCRFVQNEAVAGIDSDVQFADGSSERVLYPGRGGVVNSSYLFFAANCLFANNEAQNNLGGFISGQLLGVGGVNVTGEYGLMQAMNCNFVRNKADGGYPVAYVYRPNRGYTDINDEANVANNPHKILNSVFWGNSSSPGTSPEVIRFKDSDPMSPGYDPKADALWFCAYEEGTGLPPVNKANDIAAGRDFRALGYIYDGYVPAIIKNEFTNAGVYTPGDELATQNIILSADNNAADGPNFVAPSLKAGVGGYMPSADWMVGRVNNLTDNGWGKLEQNIQLDQSTGQYTCTFSEYTDQFGNKQYKGTGAYVKIACKLNGTENSYALQNGIMRMPYGEQPYMDYASGTLRNMLRISKDPNPSKGQTYIDIGVYEYQHTPLHAFTDADETDVLWVTEQERQGVQSADGSTWETATSDLQRAIETLLASRNGHRKEIRLLNGIYQPVYTIGQNLGFTINTSALNNGVIIPESSTGDGSPMGVKSLTIRGGYSRDINGLYNVEQYPAVIKASNRTGVNDYMKAHAIIIADMQQIATQRNGDNTYVHNQTGHVVPLTIDGVCIANTAAYPHLHTNPDGNTDYVGGAAIYYAPQYQKQNTDGTGQDDSSKPLQAPDNGEKKFTLSNCKIFDNGKTKDELSAAGGAYSGFDPAPAVTILQGGGDALVFNTLFHSNAGHPLQAADTKVVNCTFALNGGHAELSGSAIAGTTGSELHNSLLWLNDIGQTDTSARRDVEWPDKNAAGETQPDAGKMTYNAISHLPEGYTDQYHNDPLSADNANVLAGPNFYNPDHSGAGLPDHDAIARRDFKVKPSVRVVRKADIDTYFNLVVKSRWPQTDFSSATAAEREDSVRAHIELAHRSRIYGGGMERGAYESIATLSRVLYVDPAKVGTDATGFSWETAYGKGELQKAVDAAAVYTNITQPTADNDTKSYVIVKSLPTPLGELIIPREGVCVYGGVASTYVGQAVGNTPESVDYTDKQVAEFLGDMLYSRPAIAATATEHSVIGGVKTANGQGAVGKGQVLGSLIDGFVITAQGVQAQPVVSLEHDPVALKGCIITGNEMDGSCPVADIQSGLLYNSLVRDNSLEPYHGSATYPLVSLGNHGYVLNCTVVPAHQLENAFSGNAAEGRILNTIAEGLRKYADSGQNDDNHYAPYMQAGRTDAYLAKLPAHKTANRNLWYQLSEQSSYINSGLPDTGNGGVASHFANEDAPLKAFVNFKADRDLLGNPRVIGSAPDLGCYETWFVCDNSPAFVIDDTGNGPSASDDSEGTYGGHYYPHNESVVYVRDGGVLRLGSGIGSKPMFTAADPIRPGYLQISGSGSVYCHKNHLQADYVAVERYMGTAQYAQVAMPFPMNYTPASGFVTTTTTMKHNGEQSEYGENVAEVPVDGYTVCTYDGAARSAWHYSYTADNSKLWQPLSLPAPANGGVLFERADANPSTWRFTTFADTPRQYVYTEDGTLKTVVLQQYDDRTSTAGGADFTNMYNMGWNMAGMPYLVSGYSTGGSDGAWQMNVPHLLYTMTETGTYRAAVESWSEGAALSAGQAYFTQTAVLGPTETLTFGIPQYAAGNEDASAARFALAITAGDGTADEITVRPGGTAGRMQYAFGADGAKIAPLNTAVPQIYLNAAGGERLSLAAAAPVETDLPLGVALSAAGQYTISLPDTDCYRKYGAVWLADRETGSVANLLDSDFHISAEAPLSTDTRFVLRIGGLRPDGTHSDTAPAFTVTSRGGIMTVKGIAEGDSVAIMTAGGATLVRTTATAATYSHRVQPGAVYVVTVNGRSRKAMGR